MPSTRLTSHAPTTTPANAPPHFDPLAVALDGVHFRCMLPGAHEMTAPWGVRFGGVTAQQLRRHAASLGLAPAPGDPPIPRAAFVAVLDGACWLGVEQYKANVLLNAGDVAIITRDVPFTLRDDPRTHARPLLELLEREDIEQLRGLRHGGGGAATTFLAGGFIFDDQENPLLASLPAVIHVRGQTCIAAPCLPDTLRLLACELSARRPGMRSVAEHLARALFVQTMREYIGALGPLEIPPLLDADMAPALGLMHLHPEAPWTVATLARQTNSSRSAFAARFTAAVGRPPLQYLTECRMRKARTLLRETRLGIKAVAQKVGYGTESAFSSAFKRMTGISPMAYRQTGTA